MEGWIRELFFFIDKGIFKAVEWAYNLIVELAGISLLNIDAIQSFAGRIYTFIGIFMLFKIAISLINYFINPESFNDSKQGMSSILKRIIISFILVIAVPIIFEYGYKLQSMLLRNNILATAVFGDADSTETYSQTYSNGGNVIAVTVFKGFFVLKNGYTADDVYEKNPQLEDVEVGDFSDLITLKEGSNYKYDYNLPLSTLAGGLAAWVLIMFCFDVAVRSVKLSFLQLIAPVPVLSYIDPKKGDKIFRDWVSECFSTFLSLFIRLVALYFVIFILATLISNGMDVYEPGTNQTVTLSSFGRVFIILGLLLFMKEAPKMICQILGIKDTGGFTLNPLKKLGEVPLVGKASATLVGGVDSKLHGKSFLAGAYRGSKTISIGGDKNKSILGAATNYKEDFQQKLHGMDAYSHYQNLRKNGQGYYEEQKELEGKGEPEENVFKHQQFRESYKAVGDAKTEANQAASALTYASNELQTEMQKGDAADQNKLATLKAAYEAASKKANQTQGRLEYVKKIHDSVREMYQDDARIEDSIEAYKKWSGEGTDRPENVETDSPGRVVDPIVINGQRLGSRPPVSPPPGNTPPGNTPPGNTPPVSPPPGNTPPGNTPPGNPPGNTQ